MKALIIGANSQDGYYLSELCKIKQIDPICVSRSSNFIVVNIGKYEQVERLITTYKPDYIFHFAANSSLNHDTILENHQTISTGTINILEAVKRHKAEAKVFITGSGLQFKNQFKPISENEEFEANSAYSVARINAAYAARYYRSIGINTYIGYLFHHESPFRKKSHVSQQIIQFVKELSSGENSILEIGDISVRKEWTFAGDIAKAIFTMVEQNKIFEAAIGSGKTHSIQEWLEVCFNLIGKNWVDHVRVRRDFKAAYPILVSDPSTIQSLGWKPEIELLELAQMMFDKN